MRIHLLNNYTENFKISFKYTFYFLNIMNILATAKNSNNKINETMITDTTNNGKIKKIY